MDPAAGREVAELKERLLEQETMLSAIVETVPGALISIDEKGSITSFSRGAERMFGYEEAEVVGRNINMLMPSPYREEHDDYLANYRRTGVKKIIGIGRVVVAQRKDGNTFPIELQVGQMQTKSGRQFLGFVRDITASERVERQIHQLQTNLLQSSRLTVMSEMASALAHELNQPLSAIMGYVDAAQHVLASGPGKGMTRVQDVLAKAASQARRAGQIVHHLRHFVLTGETEKSEEDLNLVVQDSLAMALTGAGQKISMNLQLSGNLPKALIDRVQIQQVIVNLIRNAVDVLADTSGGIISLSTTQRSTDFLELRVGDNGPGIAAEVADRLFHPFVTTKPKGMGIGLSMCKSIIDSHGGKIWVEEGLSGGAAFAFTVPIARDQGDERRG
jgi:two-component system sensor kinase FixL